MLGEIIIQGIISGATYSLLALGFALIFGAARIVNLYHGSFYMLGAYFAYSFVSLGIPVGFAALLSLGLVGVMGILVFKIIEPIRTKGVAVLIVTIGLAILTQELLKLKFFYGAGNKSLPKFINILSESGEKITNIKLLGASVPTDRIFAFVIALIMIGVLWFFMERTKTGRAVMAVAQDEDAAMTVGVKPRVVNMVAIALSAILAGVAGIVNAPFLPINNHMWLSPLIKAFAIVILGGLGSVWGSVMAAFILSFAEAASNNLINPSFGGVVFLVVVLIMLFVRPQGLMGKSLKF